ncbi:MAG: hypothetical protein F6J97_15860 [Leptolyngbya sp. SIO4C1]|nr:hypothetical protein [Leptolyngbya sp. SIO4C1]
MAALTPQQEKNIEAFITALAQQEESLPAGLQSQLQAIGQNLENRATELNAIAASLPSLNQAYQTALNEVHSSEPSATPVSASDQSASDKLLEQAAQVFTADDPVQAAQRQSRSFGQVATNPLKRLFRRG